MKAEVRECHATKRWSNLVRDPCCRYMMLIREEIAGIGFSAIQGVPSRGCGCSAVAQGDVRRVAHQPRGGGDTTSLLSVVHGRRRVSDLASGMVLTRTCMKCRKIFCGRSVGTGGCQEVNCHSQHDVG